MRYPAINNRTIEWRVHQLMVAAGIETAVELHRRLKLVDPDAVNFSRLAQIVDVAPARISTRTLLGLAVTSIAMWATSSVWCLTRTTLERNRTVPVHKNLQRGPSPLGDGGIWEQ